MVKRILVLAGMALVLVVVLAWLAGREQAPAVNVARAAMEPLVVSITGNGKVEPVTPHTLRAPLATFVAKVHALEGRAVRRGELLVEMDSAEARAELARARADLLAAGDTLRLARAGGRPDELAQLAADRKNAEAELARLRREGEAIQRLLERQAATRDELERNQQALSRAEAQWQLLEKRAAELARRAEFDVQRATLQAEQARNSIRSLEEKVRGARVTSPVDGTLYTLGVRDADFVRPGDLIAEVADLSRVRVRAFVDEPDLGGLREDQTVDITWDAMLGRTWNGTVEVVPQSVVTRGTRSVGEVLCAVDNAGGHLLPNINVNVRIRVREQSAALVVPRGAVRTEDGQRFVYIVEGNTLRRRAIQVGMAGATQFEIVSGLQAGDRVALPGAVELRDGLRIRPLE